jgi:hypothetical protein
MTKLSKSDTSETEKLPSVPSVRDEDAWLVPMTPADMSPEAFGQLAHMVARKGYTEAELAYAVEQMMYDDQLTKELTSFRNRAILYPSDFERFISKHREMRRRLDRVIDRHEMNRMITEFDEISRSDFGICGYTVKDKPLFRYKQDPEAGDGEVQPQIAADDRPGAGRERPDEPSGPQPVGEHIDAAAYGRDAAPQETQNEHTNGDA